MALVKFDTSTKGKHVFVNPECVSCLFPKTEKIHSGKTLEGTNIFFVGAEEDCVFTPLHINEVAYILSNVMSK